MKRSANFVGDLSIHYAFPSHVHYNKAVEILPAVDDPEDAEILRSDLASIEFG
jgi:hypothetical protein